MGQVEGKMTTCTPLFFHSLVMKLTVVAVVASVKLLVILYTNAQNKIFGFQINQQGQLF
jgi:hypothetical protein